MAVRARGFTLVELLVALVLAALLVLMLSELLGDLGRAWSRGHVENDARRAIFDDAGLLRQWIALTQPVGPKRGFDLAGDPSGLHATIAAPAAIATAGLMRLDLRVERGAQAVALAVTAKPVDGASANAVPTGVHRLFVGMRSLSFSYFPQGRTGSPVARWSDTRLPPRAVILRIENAEGERIVIALPIALNMPEGCVYDPVSLACR